jgi:hypothetical protein
MHGKDEAIAPVFSSALGVHCVVPHNFDTDQFGTFSGEIGREIGAIETARLKCLAAMERTDCDLALASEGSFGQHPTLFFTPANEELLVLIDRKNGLEIYERELSTQTNFRSQRVSNEHELHVFLKSVGFPSHGVILKKSNDDLSEMVKGITDEQQVFQLFADFQKLYGSAHIETDMRALYNPTRLRLIQQTAEKLVQKIMRICPACQTPGFGVTSTKQGLPCQLCSFPTKSTLSYISCCQKCEYSLEQHYPHNKQTEDPMYCDYCNP